MEDSSLGSIESSEAEPVPSVSVPMMTVLPHPIQMAPFSSMLPPAVPMMRPPILPHPPSLPPPPVLSVPIPIPVKSEPAGPRPIASIPVPATPWSVVWSSDDRTFFFNATNRKSLWTIPEELTGNPNVHKILNNPPGGKSEWIRPYP